MQTHHLKTHTLYFDAIKFGDKSFEVRKNDRFFQRGDTVVLRNFNPVIGAYVRALGDGNTMICDEAETLTFRVGAVLQGGQFGIEPGYCVFSLIPLEEPSNG